LAAVKIPAVEMCAMTPCSVVRWYQCVRVTDCSWRQVWNGILWK